MSQRDEDVDNQVIDQFLSYGVKFIPLQSIGIDEDQAELSSQSSEVSTEVIDLWDENDNVDNQDLPIIDGNEAMDQPDIGGINDVSEPHLLLEESSILQENEENVVVGNEVNGNEEGNMNSTDPILEFVDQLDSNDQVGTFSIPTDFTLVPSSENPHLLLIAPANQVDDDAIPDGNIVLENNNVVTSPPIDLSNQVPTEDHKVRLAKNKAYKKFVQASNSAKLDAQLERDVSRRDMSRERKRSKEPIIANKQFYDTAGHYQKTLRATQIDRALNVAANLCLEEDMDGLKEWANSMSTFKMDFSGYSSTQKYDSRMEPDVHSYMFLEKHFDGATSKVMPIETPDDGNCFYHAISLQLSGNHDLTKELRLSSLVGAINDFDRIAERAKNEGFTFYSFMDQSIEKSQTNAFCELRTLATNKAWVGPTASLGLSFDANIAVDFCYPPENGPNDMAGTIFGKLFTSKTQGEGVEGEQEIITKVKIFVYLVILYFSSTITFKMNQNE